jgi:dienelactone hydrolase
MSEPEFLSFPTNPAPGIRPVRISATLHLPDAQTPAPAMVLLTSSGGVQRHREHWYAENLNASGIAALIVDSFKPRGVRNTVTDQRQVSAWEMENDAFAALDLLRHDERIDPARIGIMGVSKGGIAAIASAVEIRKRWRRTGEMLFALHVAIVPGCTVQHRIPRSTGKPMLFQLAEKDDYTPAALCQTYATRFRELGNERVVVKLYEGAHHGWEAIGLLHELRRAENYSHCRALVEDNGSLFVPQVARHMSQDEYSIWARENCMFIGRTHAGGGTVELRRRTTADLLDFLKANGF